MDNTSKYFSDLFESWAETQQKVWQTQSKVFEDAGTAYARAFAAGDGGAPPAGDFSGLFESLWAQTRQAFDGWGEVLQSLAPGGDDSVIGAEVLARLMDPGAWLNLGINELNQNIEILAEGAKFADMWSAERGALKASKEWLELRRHSLHYRYVIISAWMRAFDRFSARVKKDFTAPDGAAPPFQDLIPIWLELANEELLKTQRSPEFLEAQRNLLRASMDFRARQQRVVEQMCEAQAMPTRTEVDDLHRTVTELRRDMRALKAEIARLRGANGAPGGGAARARARAKPRRKAPKADKRPPLEPGNPT